MPRNLSRRRSLGFGESFAKMSAVTFCITHDIQEFPLSVHPHSCGHFFFFFFFVLFFGNTNISRTPRGLHPSTTTFPTQSNFVPVHTHRVKFLRIYMHELPAIPDDHIRRTQIFQKKKVLISSASGILPTLLLMSKFLHTIAECPKT